MIFDTMSELRMQFTRRAFVPEQKIQVGGIGYHYSSSNNPPVDKIINEGRNLFMVYVIDPSTINQATYQNISKSDQHGDETQPGSMLAFMWKWNPNIKVIMPVNVRPTKPQRLSSLELDKMPLGEQQSLGLTSEIEFVQLGTTVPAKIDTGATISSLHADDWTVEGDSVVFKSSIFKKVLRAPTDGSHDVHTSDGGVENRPVVAFDVRINGRLIQNAHFNLNNRSNMDFPVLIGQNILKQGNFTIDPSVENINWGELDKLFEDDTFTNLPFDLPGDPTKIKQAIDVFETNDVSFKDLMKYIRTRAIETLEY